MSIIFDENDEVSDVVYKSIQDFPSPFEGGNSISCQGRPLFFGGFHSSYDYEGKIFEYDMDEFQVISNSNEIPNDAGCCYHKKN